MTKKLPFRVHKLQRFRPLCVVSPFRGQCKATQMNMNPVEPHPCVGCGANARLTRKERGEHGGFYLTFACERCGTREIIKTGGELALERLERSVASLPEG